MEEIKTFKLCSDYRRDDFDFAEIQTSKNNPVVRGIPTYPYLMPSNKGTSFTYKLAPDLFFKRKLQDGGISSSFRSSSYNELCGTFDDLAEVISYFLAKELIDPQTGKNIVEVPEYRLATFTDKNGTVQRGCVSKNVCKDQNEQLMSMRDILKLTSHNQNANSIEDYMKAIENYMKIANIKCDLEAMRRALILKSEYSWLNANSDDTNSNVTVIKRKLQYGSFELIPGGIIDNGSSFEMSSPYLSGGTSSGQSYHQDLLLDDSYSSTNPNGERVFDFQSYPRMHTAFHLNPKTLLFSDTKWGSENYAYEYCLACEMLSDKELFRLSYEIKTQLDIEKAIKAVDETYGASIKGAPKSIEWPPLLKDYMRETHKYKKRILSFVVADYYLDAAFNAFIEKSDRKKPSKLYSIFQEKMLGLPLQSSKEAYDERFLNIANLLGIEVDKEKLASLEFKTQEGPAKAEQQPS